MISGDHLGDLAGHIALLRKALLWASNNERGVPQNHDPSSFFCSALLSDIDRAMSRQRGIQYFRYVDDIRMAAPTRGQAINALHELQDSLRVRGFFLNTAKTKLLEPHKRAWNGEVDATHDAKLSEYKECIDRRIAGELSAKLPAVLADFRVAASDENDRLLRAYGNRLLEMGSFAELLPTVASALVPVALEAMRSAPARADSWCRYLSLDVSESVVDELTRLLSDADYNTHPWTNMWIIITIARFVGSLPGATMDVLWSLARDRSQPVFVRGWAMVAIGRHGHASDEQSHAD